MIQDEKSKVNQKRALDIKNNVWENPGLNLDTNNKEMKKRLEELFPSLEKRTEAPQKSAKEEGKESTQSKGGQGPPP